MSIELHKVSELLHVLKDGAAYFEPIYDEGRVITDFKVLFANQAAAQMYEVPHEQMINRGLKDLLSPKQASECFARFSKVYLTGTPLHDDISGEINGTKRWFRVSMYRTKEGLGEFFQDITFVKQVELDHRKERELIEAFLEHSSSSVWVKNTKFVYTFVNRGMENLMGKPYPHLVGKTDYDLFPLDLASAFQAIDQDVLAREKASTHVQFIPLKGKMRQYLTHKFPIFSQEGEILGLGGIATEIDDSLNAVSK